MKNDAITRLEALQNEGDDLSVDRPIYHLVHFDDEANAIAFRNEIVNKGYVVSKGDQEGEWIILHILPLDLVKIMAHVYELANIAIEYQGTYIHWHTTRRD